MKHNLLIYGAGVFLVCTILSAAIISSWIGFAVEDACSAAQRDYKIDTCTRALITRMNDTSQSFRERNDAIWALGQQGDKSALSALKQLQKPDKTYRGYDVELSQYELSKAVNLLEGGTNLTPYLRGEWNR